MVVGVFDGDAEGGGGGVEVEVGRDEGDGLEAVGQMLIRQFDNCRQLNGIVGAEAVLFRIVGRIFENGLRDLDDVELKSEIDPKLLNRVGSINCRNATGVSSTGNRGNHFHKCDSRNVNAVAGSWSNQRFNPLRANFRNVLLHETAGVDEVKRHYRRSLITVSESGSPLIGTGLTR